MTRAVIEDPNWWPHRYDPVKNHVHYIAASRNDHRNAVFLTDEYLESSKKPKVVPFSDVIQNNGKAPLQFIFHSAYCCSTLLARAFDIPGKAMGYKEPQILNDLYGWYLRGARPEQIAQAMNGVLGTLGHPFATGETNVVKPSNVVNGLAGLMLHLRPDANAIFLYAPLKDFLGSIARKGMWGRHWVRDLMVKQMKLGLINLGLQGDDYLTLTDLQAAAVGWLAQHALMLQVMHKFGMERVKTIDSNRLMANPPESLLQTSLLFGIPLDDDELGAVVNGPAFTKHAKTNEEFSVDERENEKHLGAELHADEIEKVFAWAEVVAKNAGLPLNLPNSLI